MMKTYNFTEDSRFYFVGGGIASMSAAVFLTRDAKVKGENIYVLEQMNINGGSCDGAGDPDQGYMIRGGRMLNYQHYVCIFGLLESVPALSDPKRTVRDEIYHFNNMIQSDSHARLVDKDHQIVDDADDLGFDNYDRTCMTKLLLADENSLGEVRIDQFFGPHFFTTNFWYMWCTTFAFQPWHSAFEFKRYAHAFINELPRIHTLGGVRRTTMNQYDSIILPMQKHLESQGVSFVTNCRVVDIDFREDENGMTATGIHTTKNGTEEIIALRDNDFICVTNGTMTENSTIGTMDAPAPEPTKENNGCWALWEKLALRTPEFGNPDPFCNNMPESLWQSFTVTLKDAEHKFIKKYFDFSSNKPGTGGLMTFKNSGWFMSIVVPYQPHFSNQPEEVDTFWGYGLYPDKPGDYVKKPMVQCSGAEIFTELCYQLGWQDDLPGFLDTTICLPCIMPYITSQFMTRKKTDRPLVVPECSNNIAFIGQFAEMPDVVSFTVEMSVRTAQEAVYTLCGLHDYKKLPAFYKGEYDCRVLLGAGASMMK